MDEGVNGCVAGWMGWWVGGGWKEGQTDGWLGKWMCRYRTDSVAPGCLPLLSPHGVHSAEHTQK